MRRRVNRCLVTRLGVLVTLMIATIVVIGPLAQRLEQRTHNPLVVGSNPTGPTSSDDWKAALRMEISSFLVGAGRFERPTPCAQGRCATRLRYAPTFSGLFILKHFLTRRTSATRTKIAQNGPNRVKTVPKPHQLGLSVSKLRLLSFACRFSFCRASRFICSFICEYFLNTFASPCRSNCVTHSSATPPALRRVAYVDRRS